MTYQAAIFDLDGTLLDTLEDLWGSVNHTLRAHDMPERSRDDVRAFLGNGMRTLMHLSVPAGTSPEVEARLLAEFKEHYAVHSADHTAPYPQVVKLIEILAGEGVRRGVVSNKDDFAVQDLVERYFPHMFDVVVGERAGIRRKPAPDTVLAVTRKLSVGVNDVIYVGDSEVDLETAANVGCACAAVSWGFRDRDFLVAHGATLIADTTEELAEAILM